MGIILLSRRFLTGLYNPSGSQHQIRFFMRRYQHTHVPLSDITDDDLKNAVKNLKRIPKEHKMINRNGIGHVFLLLREACSARTIVPLPSVLLIRTTFLIDFDTRLSECHNLFTVS